MTSCRVYGIDDQIDRRIEQVSNLIGQYVEFWLRSKVSLNSNLNVSLTFGTFMSYGLIFITVKGQLHKYSHYVKF